MSTSTGSFCFLNFVILSLSLESAFSAQFLGSRNCFWHWAEYGNW